MSRRQRAKGGRNRESKQQRRRRRRMSLAWVGIIIVAVVVGLVAYLIIAADSGTSEDALAAEANDDPALPGEFVDLIAIYGGPYSETAGHVQEPVDYNAVGNSNPPAGGPHWSGGCGDEAAEAPQFCGPAPWGIYREPWEPETLVHNMEHGGAVLWYNSTDTGLIREIEEVILDLQEDLDLLVMAPYPDMEADTIALTSWSRIDKFRVSEYSEERVRDFMETHVRRFNPEHF